METRDWEKLMLLTVAAIINPLWQHMDSALIKIMISIVQLYFSDRPYPLPPGHCTHTLLGSRTWQVNAKADQYPFLVPGPTNQPASFFLPLPAESISWFASFSQLCRRTASRPHLGLRSCVVQPGALPGLHWFGSHARPGSTSTTYRSQCVLSDSHRLFSIRFTYAFHFHS